MKFLRSTKQGKKVYANHREEPYYSYVESGEKTIEGRLCKGLYKELTQGDLIAVHKRNSDEFLLVEVTDIQTYASFKEMLEKEDFKKVLPNTASVEEGVKIYEQFYTKEQVDTHGVLAIHFKRILN